MNQTEEQPKYGTWGILDQNGHHRLAGWVTEETLFGSKLGRIEVLSSDGKAVLRTYYFGGESIYGFSPCSEESARIAAGRTSPDPIDAYDVRTLVASQVKMEHEYQQRQGARSEEELLRDAVWRNAIPVTSGGLPGRLTVREGRLAVACPDDPDYRWTLEERIGKLRDQAIHTDVMDMANDDQSDDQGVVEGEGIDG